MVNCRCAMSVHLLGLWIMREEDVDKFLDNPFP